MSIFETTIEEGDEYEKKTILIDRQIIDRLQNSSKEDLEGAHSAMCLMVSCLTDGTSEKIQKFVLGGQDKLVKFCVFNWLKTEIQLIEERIKELEKEEKKDE